MLNAIFGKRSEPVETALRERVKALEEQVSKLQSELRTVQGEWLETHSQLMRQANRLRRYAKVDGHDVGEMPAAGNSERPAGIVEVPREVLLRRGGSGGVHP